jgi:dipeptidyl-peptidase-3
VDPVLHAEVLERFKKLGIAPYAGFVNPELKLVKGENGEVKEVTVGYAKDYTRQMLFYSDIYGFL